ncbi:MAG: glycosyltransferase [Desulfuromonadales bacterium]|nr:glycosyltransferase [Desulfuromonadales bacterium]
MSLARERGSIVESLKMSLPSGEAKFRILLVSYYCPTRAHAGGLRILDIYELIRQRCPDVQLDLLTHHRPTIDWSLDEVYQIFHNVYLSPTEDLTPDGLTALRGSPMTYDVIDHQFHQSGYQIDAFKCIGDKIIFTPMESMVKVLFVDLADAFKHISRKIIFTPIKLLSKILFIDPHSKFLTHDRLRPLNIPLALHLAAHEVKFTLKADEVVCVGQKDAACIRAVALSRHVRGVDTGVSQFEFAEALAPNFTSTSATDRPCRLLYVAYFGSETNVIALRWYLDHVHHLVKASVPDYIFTVVGRGDISSFSKYADNSIEFVGEVPALAPHIQQARVCIAPAFNGSGLRGKINQYAVLGVPCVVSPISARGLAYQDGVNIFIAKNPEVFADRCVRLLTDSDLNNRMGHAARQLCIKHYSWQSKWAAIRKIYKLKELS